MKNIFVAFIFAVLVLFAVNEVSAVQRVGGYVKKNGTYVKPYYKTSPNGSKLDNYSNKGNINPYTGKRGTSR